MKRFGALAIAVAMTVAACGGSNEATPEPDVEVEAVDGGVVREAGGDFEAGIEPFGEAGGGVQVVNGCRIEANTQCHGANLRGANLRDANLSGADLSGANLEGADLRGANLSNANLSGADLSEAALNGVNLDGSILAGADLRWANLSGVNLSGANLSAAKFCNTIMPDWSVQNDNC